MKQLYTLIALAAMTLPAMAAVQSYSFTFAPAQDSELTLQEYSGAALNTSFYYINNYNFNAGWQRSVTSTNSGEDRAGMVAMVSPSRLENSATPDAWLIMPELAVNTNTALCWTARSVNKATPDSYDVMISEGGMAKEDFKLLCHVEKEQYFMHPRFQSLSEYNGKNVRIAFVHNDPEGYLLAITNVEAGTPSWGYEARNVGHLFFGRNDTQELIFDLTNLGGYDSKEPTAISVVSSSDHGNVLSTLPFPTELKAGATTRVTLPTGLEVGTAMKYDLILNYSNGDERLLLSDYINVSEFRRTTLIEKVSGVWCSNCPKMMYPAHVYEELFGLDGIYMECHYTKDFNSCDEYIQPIFYSIGGDLPSLMLNRSQRQNSYKAFDRSILEPTMLEPCTASVKISQSLFEDDTIYIEALVEVAEEYDNSDGKYRVGFTLTEDHAYIPEGEQLQSNAQGYGTTIVYGEANFFPTKVPAEVTAFDNIVRACSEGGGAGIEGSLPAEKLVPGKQYSVYWSTPVPENVVDREKIKIVAYMNEFTENKSTQRGKIYNADATRIDFTQTGVSHINSEADDSIRARINGDNVEIELPAAGEYHVAIYNAVGMLVAESEGNGALAVVSANALRGIGIAVVEIDGKQYNAKIIK